MDLMPILTLFVLLFLSGLFSGLNPALLGLSKERLQIQAEVGNRLAAKVYKIRQDIYLLLNTLLCGNSAVNVTFAILLANVISFDPIVLEIWDYKVKIFSDYIAATIGTLAVLMFGEILPQALCLRYPIIIGGRTAWIIRFFMILLYPITIIIKKGLELVIGGETMRIWPKREIIRLVADHAEHPESTIDKDEFAIVQNALAFSEKIVQEIMIPLNRAFVLNVEERLTRRLRYVIDKVDYSRIPIFGGDPGRLANYLGILYVKDLITPGKKGNTLRGRFRKNKIESVLPDARLDDVLDRMRTTKVHLIFITNSDDRVLGIVTLSDIIDQIVGISDAD